MRTEWRGCLAAVPRRTRPVELEPVNLFLLDAQHGAALQKGGSDACHRADVDIRHAESDRGWAACGAHTRRVRPEAPAWMRVQAAGGHFSTAESCSAAACPRLLPVEVKLDRLFISKCKSRHGQS